MGILSGCVITVLDYLQDKQLSLTTIKNNDSDGMPITLKEGRKYIIPSFQRELRWQLQNVNTLLFDLSRGPIFLGNFILSIRDGLDVEIIDGQQRTVVLYLVIKAIEKKYGDALSIVDCCHLRNDSFDGFFDILCSYFEDKELLVDDKDELLQFPRLKQLWDVIFSSDYISDSYKAEDLYNNLKRSTLSIIVEKSDDVAESIRFFLDVNLKGIRLDNEDIFKGYLLNIDNSQSMREMWIDIKKSALRINKNVEKPVYPLMKLYEHFLLCEIYRKQEYSGLDFGEDFCLKTTKKVFSKTFYQGTHVLEVIRDKAYVRLLLNKLQRIITIVEDVLNNTSPSKSFKGYYIIENGKIDDIEIQNSFLLLKKILEDSEIISKAFILRYISSFFDGIAHEKTEYKSIYSVFTISSLFTIFANRKRSERVYSIIKSDNWIEEMNSWISEFINSIELTRGKLRVAYYEPEEDDDFSSTIRCKSIGIITNYFCLSENNGKNTIKVTNSEKLHSYLTNKEKYSLEHFIIPNSGKYKFFIGGNEITYSVPKSIKAYRNSIFNYIFIPKDLNSQIKNCLFKEKLNCFGDVVLDCSYSSNFIQMLESGSFFKKCPKQKVLRIKTYKEKLDKYFNDVFLDEFIEFANAISRCIIIKENEN